MHVALCRKAYDNCEIIEQPLYRFETTSNRSLISKASDGLRNNIAKTLLSRREEEQKEVLSILTNFCSVFPTN
jgi:hypothetical protein